MPLEDSERPFRPKETLHIPTPLIGGVVAILVVLLLTYKGGQRQRLQLVLLKQIAYCVHHHACWYILAAAKPKHQPWNRNTQGCGLRL